MATEKKSPTPLWVKDLIEEQIEALRAGLSMGKSAPAMAKAFREKYPNLWPEMSVKQIGSRFAQYKKQVIAPEQQKALMVAFKERQSDTRKNIDVLGELEEMIALHKQRIRVALAAEEAFAVNFEPINDEIERHTLMLDRLAKVYLEVGVITRVPKKISHSLSEMMGGRKVFDWTEEDSKRIEKTGLLEGVTYSEVSGDEEEK